VLEFRFIERARVRARVRVCVKESKKLSALLFFQFFYTKVGVERVRHFST
jgi:hypothetical protein